MDRGELHGTTPASSIFCAILLRFNVLTCFSFCDNNTTTVSFYFGSRPPEKRVREEFATKYVTFFLYICILYVCIYISFNKQTNPFCLEKGYGISVTLTLGNTHLTQCLLTLLDLINQKVDVALVTLCYTGLLQLIVHTHTLKMVKQYISIIYIFLTKFDSLCVLAVTASVHCHCLLALYLLTHPFPSFASQCIELCNIMLSVTSMVLALIV